MTRRLIFTIAGLLLFAAGGGRTGDAPADGTICPRPSAPGFEARLRALELENGCLDDDQGNQGAEAPSWPPGWKQATIAGGDVAPIRVVSDPYPTLHSVVVDAERNKVFMSDPNRHALWSYDRLAATKGKGMIDPLTGLRR